MNFTSPLFLVLYPVTLLLWRRLPTQARTPLLLAVSWLFYAAGQPGALPLLLADTLVTYAAGRGVAAAAGPGSQRCWLTLGVGVPLALLFFFKYLSFAASLVGLSVPSLPLPAGISFYTFQAIAYVLDTARGEKPEKQFVSYALFVSFFPQLVAGPIERSHDLLPQLRAAADPGPQDVQAGMQYLLRGYFKKLVLADFAARFVEPVYADAASACGPAVLGATLLFALQIYCDFSGYSDIACGAARLLGVRLTENFRAPYHAASPREFWQRWHRTLTRWFTDYLYIPLGGRQHRVRNLLLVFLVSGLWHGAGWTFLVWGLLHGVYQILWDRWQPVLPRRVGQALTFGLVCLAWVFFRAASLGDALRLLAALPTGWNAPVLPGFTLWDAAQLGLGLAVLRRMDPWPRPFAWDAATRNTAFFLLSAIGWGWLSLLAQGADSAFLYFQF